MQRVDVKHFKLVRAIFEQGSLSGAARTLHLTQSALSHQLKILEEDCGQQLFLREGKRLLLTLAGERFLEAAHDVLSSLELLSQDLKQIASGETGRIRVSTECYTTFMWLPQILPLFQTRYPSVEIEVVPLISDVLLDELSAGKVDVAIRMSSAKPPYESHALFKDELKVYMHPAHELAKQENISAQDFADETLVVCPVARKRLLQGLFYDTQYTPKRIIDMPLNEAVLAWCAAKLGVCVMAEWAVTDMVAGYDLLAKPLAMPWMNRTWHAVTLNQKQPEATEYFIHLLRELKPSKRS
jgi:LysR family transcriptional regulator, regulator for metE and metH